MVRLLIVDDHEVVRRGLLDILRAHFGPESQFGEAQDAREAVNRLAASDWDVVLLDLNLPGRDGFEVLDDVTRLLPDVPVLVLTAYPEEEFAVRAFTSGAAGYLNKQSAADELVAAVERVLSGGKYVTASMAQRLAAHLGSAGAGPPHDALSSRELQVLRLVAVGRSTKEIADELALSEKTIATYRARIAGKTGLRSNVDIARYALKCGLVH